MPSPLWYIVHDVRSTGFPTRLSVSSAGSSIPSHDSTLFWLCEKLASISHPQLRFSSAETARPTSCPQFATLPTLKFTLDVKPSDGMVERDWIASSVVWW